MAAGAGAATVVSQGIGRTANASKQSPQATAADTRHKLFSHSPIEVYTNTLSAAAGDEVTIHVSTTAKSFHLQIARIGLEEKVLWTQVRLPGVFHPAPEDAAENGCRWPVSARLIIPADWKSGYYQIKAITENEDTPGKEYLAFVVVRAKKPAAKILIVLTTNTYGAYNSYGGASLYQARPLGDGKLSGGNRISFQRPIIPGFLWKPESYDVDVEVNSLLPNPEEFDLSDPMMPHKKSGIPYVACAAGFHNWERLMVHWLERNGYAVDYAINSDLELHPQLLGRYRLMLSVGHDEYWSWGMRDTVESFIAKGGNVCFFSGDVSTWQVRFEDQGSSMVCYKEGYKDDPAFKAGQKQLATTYWTNLDVNRPESRMTGLSYWYAGFSRFRGVVGQGPGGYLIYRPENWIFKDSGIGYGDCLGQASKIVHYEVDGCPIRMKNGLPYPEEFHDGPSSLVILGMVPAAQDVGAYSARQISVEEYLHKFGPTGPQAVEYLMGNRGHAVMSMYVNNGTVFCAGTTDWTSGLTGKDPAVERITKNLLDRLST